MRKHIIILSIFILSTTTLLAQRTGIRLARLEEAPDVGAMIIANGDTFATWSAALRYVDGFILANGDTVATRDYARQFGGLSESEVSAIVSDTADVLRTYADQSEQDAKDYADANDADTQLTQEQVEDFAGGIFTGNTESLITSTYDDPTGKVNLVVESNLSNYTNDAGFLTAEGDPVWIADSINYATKTYTDQAEQDAKDYADANDDSGTDDQTLQEVLNQGNTTSSNIVFTGNNNINNTSGQIIGTISSNGDIFRGWSSLGSANRLDIGYLSSFNTIFRSAGNIGIATLSPSEKLHLGGSMFINKENAGLIVDSGSNKRVGLMKYSGLEASFVHGNTIPLRFGRVDQANVTEGNYTEEMRIATNGNVGIGTTGPQYKLDVNGTVGFPALSDGSSHANIVTQDDVTGELGYRDISSIDLWEFNPRRVDDYQIDSIYSPQFFGVRARNPQAGVTTPGNGDFFYVANFGSVTHGLQLAIPYGVSTELYYRGGTDNPLSENGSQVWKNWRKLLTEDDVSTSDVTNWNTAYGWGDHSVAGYLTSEVDGSTTNELQTIDEVLTQGNSLLANRSINVNGNQMQIGGTYAAMLARTFDVTLSSFDLSLNTADIITDTGEILLRHRLSSDVGADQDYMTLDATSLELAHRNGTIIKGDFKTGNFVWNTDQDTTGTVGQVITMSSSGELELKNSFNQVSTSNSGANFSDDLDGYSELHVAVHSNSSTLAITLPSANATNAGKTLKIFNFFSGSGAALYQLSAGNFWGSGVVSASYTASTDGRIDELTCILDPENGGYVWAVEQN